MSAIPWDARNRSTTSSRDVGAELDSAVDADPFSGFTDCVEECDVGTGDWELTADALAGRITGVRGGSAD